MKIGIYGDSYTTAHAKPNESTNWFNALAHKLESNGTIVEVKHYGRAGSSLYYSYRRFLDTFQENDLNIFLVTGPGRFPHTVELSVPGNSQTFTCKSHVENCIASLGQMLDETDTKNLANVIAWFDASTDHQYFIDMSDLMLDRVETLGRTIIYPCFTDSFTKARFAKHRLDSGMHFMHSMWIRQLDLLNIDPDDFSAEETDNVCGHLSIEFNEFFANMLYKKINTGKWDHSGFFDVTIKHPRKFYYHNFNHE